MLKLHVTVAGTRMADRERHNKVQDGDRPHDSERFRVLRVPSKQPVRSGQQGLPNRLCNDLSPLSCQVKIRRLEQCS